MQYFRLYEDYVILPRTVFETFLYVLVPSVGNPVGSGPFCRIRDPDPEYLPLDPDPALVMYIYQVIVSKKMFLTNFLKICHDIRHHVKVFTTHYVNGISWHFLRWIRIRFWTGSGSAPDPVCP